jgi:cytochrome c oxidase subunit 2
VYEGRCAEFCGENHADMRARVIAVPVDDYQAWVERQRTDILDAEKALAAQRKEQKRE